MTIAVITCCHGQAEYLPSCLSSIAAQTRQPDLHILVSDGDEEAAAIFDAYCNETAYNSQHWKHSRRRGAAAAWNTGIRRALNAATPVDWILKHDADDIAGEQYLQMLSESIDADPDVDVVFTPLQHGRDGHLATYRFPEYSRARMIRECCIPAQSAVRSELFQIVGPADTSMPAGEDWDLFVRLGLLVPLRVRQLPHAGWRYLDRGKGRVSDHVKTNISEYRKYFAGHTRETVLSGSRTWATRNEVSNV